ncbi:MAG: hypothetical protein KAI20_04400, partial [Thermoplasmatales archaeon]|nr:hypothetical protein [Thermoplasmatales archaeon]
MKRMGLLLKTAVIVAVVMAFIIPESAMEINDISHENIFLDGRDPPTIVINFAGNPDDMGGPYWRPPGESDILDEESEGMWRNGYYTNDSRQHENWIYINTTVFDADGIDEVL